MTAKDHNGQLDGLDRLLSTRSVCGLLDTSARNLRRLVASGKFPPPDRKLGRSLRWRFSTVRAFLEPEATNFMEILEPQ